MKLDSTRSESSRLLGFVAGGFKMLLAMAVFWTGINSLLIGWAYESQKGSWVPVLVGLVLMPAGTWLLTKGVAQSLRNWRSRELPREDEL